MQYYKEITLMPPVDIPLHVVFEKVFTNLHHAFVKVKTEDNSVFAISFPAYTDNTLGNCIRVFAGTEEAFKTLEKYLKFDRLSDYLRITRVREVPKHTIKGHSCYVRFQYDGSIHQKARRLAKRHDEISYDEAVKLIKRKVDLIKFPYVKTCSNSTSQQFRLFIQKKCVEGPIEGTFNTYGLSLTGSVPEF